MVEKHPDTPLSPARNHSGDSPAGPPAGASSRTLNLKPPLHHAAPSLPHQELSGSAADSTSAEEGPLLGDYELLAEVGQGGMGIVYKARHRALNRIVALKVTGASHLISAEAAQRFQIEAAAIARLDHPNIVPLYEIGEAFGQQFYSMAFVEGNSLADAVAVSPLPPRRAAELMQPVAAAIAYAHTQGVVHRDLKPENILLDAAFRPRITDFGIAKCADTDSGLTRAGQVIGTPSYMAPEQAQGHTDQVGPLSDVYSLGATLYCLLTGRPPFQAATALDTMNHVVERDPVSPRQLNPAVDRDLETICLKCLEKSPERRYASATALAEDLQRFLDQRTILARPVSPLAKVGRWCRRNPFVSGSLAGLVAVFLAAFALVSWSHWRTQEALHEEAQQRAAATEAHYNARRHEQAERWERYRANMTAVASAIQSQNVSIAQQALEAAPADHRNWEWRHFRHLLDQSRQVLAAQRGGVERVRFAAGNRLVTVDSGLRVWDLSTGRVVRTLDDFSRGEWPRLDLDPTGRVLAYPAQENTIILWDVVRDQRLAVLRGCAAPVVGFHFGPEGTTLTACTRDHHAHVWDTTTGNRLRTWLFHEGRHERRGIDVSDTRLLISNFENGTARLWDVQTGRKQSLLSGHQANVISAAFNRQGTRVVTSEAFPSNVLRLWNTETGEQIAQLRGHRNQAQGVAFSPDGKRLASCSFDQTVRLWDGLTGAPVAILRGHTGWVMALAFSPDSSRLVSASQDHTLRLWDTSDGELLAVLCGHEADVEHVAYSPDGSLIASGSADRTARLWDVRLAERNGILRGHTSFVYGVAFHPSGERLASAGWDGSIRLWNATSGSETAVLRDPQTATIYSVAVNPSGEFLAALCRDNTVRLWDVATGRQLHRWTIPTDTWLDGRLAFSPVGNLLAAASKDGTVHVWNVQTRASWAVLRGHSDAVHDVAFSPDGRWLASAGAGEDSSIRIWDVQTKEQCQVLEGHRHGVLALGFSRDGQLLASGSRDRTVQLWNTATWKPVAVLKHGTTVYSVAFTPDSTRLATGCADNSIRFWDVPTGQQVAELRAHRAYVKALAFSPDGTRLASASGDFTVRIWDTLSARSRR
jgi:WD40 repeat protein